MPRLPLVLLAAIIGGLLFAPVYSWNYPVSHVIADGTTVTRDAPAVDCGLPFAWICWRTPAWTACQVGQISAATDAQICEFVTLESAEWENFRVRCAFEDGLRIRATKQDRALLQSAPRASAAAVLWGTFGFDAAVWSLLASGCLRFWARRRKHRRERLQFEGRCGECGYYLTGNVSGRCPEC